MSNNPQKKFHLPVHQSLTPKELRFEEASPPPWLKSSIADAEIYSCKTLSRGGSHQYFHIESNIGPLFAKVKKPDASVRETQAAWLSSQLKMKGVPTCSLIKNPIYLESGDSLFLYQWVNHNFYKPCRESIVNLSDSLAQLHQAMASIDCHNNKSIHDLYKQNIDRLSKSSLADKSREVLKRFNEIYTDSPKQLTHNDLHIANVLFKGNKVCAFIDFEDSFNTSSIVLIDIAASLERFILIGQYPHLWNEFLKRYSSKSEPSITLHLSDILIVGKARCYNSLGILFKSPQPDNLNWKKEWKKFIFLLKQWEKWESSLSLTSY